jgi:protein-S-isoprenylcysteine O-methyltransferase Ste14
MDGVLMTEKRNPWNDGILAGAMILAVLACLFVLGVLVALTAGVQFTDSQNPAAQPIAGGMLALIAGMVFLFAMSSRWDRRHR